MTVEGLRIKNRNNNKHMVYWSFTATAVIAWTNITNGGIQLF